MPKWILRHRGLRGQRYEHRQYHCRLVLDLHHPRQSHSRTKLANVDGYLLILCPTDADIEGGHPVSDKVAEVEQRLHKILVGGIHSYLPPGPYTRP